MAPGIGVTSGIVRWPANGTGTGASGSSPRNDEARARPHAGAPGSAGVPPARGPQAHHCSSGRDARAPRAPRAMPWLKCKDTGVSRNPVGSTPVARATAPSRRELECDDSDDLSRPGNRARGQAQRRMKPPRFDYVRAAATEEAIDGLMRQEAGPSVSSRSAPPESHHDLGHRRTRNPRIGSPPWRARGDYHHRNPLSGEQGFDDRKDR